MDEETLVPREEDDNDLQNEKDIDEEEPEDKKAKGKMQSSGKKTARQGLLKDAGNKDCYPVLISFLRSLSDEQWQVIYKGQRNPITKEQLATLCKIIVTFIAQTTLKILLPALGRILGVSGFDDQDVQYQAKEIHTVGRGAQNLGPPTPSTKSSQTPVKGDLGLPVDSIIRCVQEQLAHHTILASCPPDLKVGLIKDVIEQLSNSRSISGHSSPIASAAQASEQMVNMVQHFLDSYTIKEDQSSTSELHVESCLPHATHEVMTVISDLVDYLEREDPELAKVLREVAVKVEMMASGNDLAVEHLDAKEPPIPEDLNMSSTSCEAMTQILAILSSKKFKTKVSTAVSEFLMRIFSNDDFGLVQTLHSFGVPLNLINVSSPSDRILHSVVTGLIKNYVDSEASKIIDVFVEDVKDIVQQAELNQSTSTQKDPLIGQFSRKWNTLYAARRLSKRLQTKLKTMFLRMGRTAVHGKEHLEKADTSNLFTEHTYPCDLPVSNLSVPSPSRCQSHLAESKSSSVSGGHKSTRLVEVIPPDPPENSKSEVILPKGNLTGLGSPHKCKSENSQPLQVICDSKLLPCTKEILSQIVTNYRSEVADLECISSAKKSSHKSIEICDFFDGVMSYLEDIPVSSHLYLEEFKDSPDSVIEKLSREDFQLKATNKVRQILVKLVRSCSGKVSSSQTDSQDTDKTAYEIADTMKSLFPHTRSTTVGQAESMLQQSDEKILEYNEVAQEIPENKIWTTAKNMYCNVRTKVHECFARQKQTKATRAQAKNTLSNILVSIQKELSELDQMEAGKTSQIQNMIVKILEDVCDEEMVWKKTQKPPSLSFSSGKSQISDCEFSLPGTPFLTELPESTVQPIISFSVLDMDQSIKPETLVCDARKSMLKIVNTILKEVYPDRQWQVTSYPDLKAAVARLEELIAQGKLVSCDLTQKVNLIISESNLSSLVLTVEGGKSESDTVPIRQKTNDNNVGMPTTSELVQLFAEESVKCLLLPSLVPSLATTSVAQGARVKASMSSTSAYSDTISQITEVMVNQVIDSVVSAAQSRGSSPTRTVTDLDSLLNGRCIGVAQSTAIDQMSASLRPTSASDKLGSGNDFASLISMLVMRTLSEIQTQTDLYPADITSTAEDLIPKVIGAFCACSYHSESQAYPDNLRMDKVFRAVYKHLLEEYGSEAILQMAMSKQDSTFNRIFIKSFSKELHHVCNNASRAASRKSLEGTQPEGLFPAISAAATRGMLSFIQRLVRIKLNLKKDSRKYSTNFKTKDQTTVEDIMWPHAAMSAHAEELPSSYEKKKPCTCPILTMFCDICGCISRP
ncbi:hypothetical protein UPYG_G00202090 [Umbra pygmaea]|uniref:Uncharacterized protein n=1 Tax=Umbra pygmaea TaxID=75934 RepID=A0ABD0WNR0_UMBPY